MPGSHASGRQPRRISPPWGPRFRRRWGCSAGLLQPSALIERPFQLNYPLVCFLKDLRQMIDGDSTIASDHQISPFRIQSHSAARDFRDWRSVENRPRCHIAVIPVLPHSNKTLPASPEESFLIVIACFPRACSTRASDRRACNDFSSFRKEFQISGPKSGSDSGFWSRDDPFWSDISAVGAVENQKRMIVHNGHQIIYWIYFHAYGAIQLRFGTMQDADRFDVAAGIAAEYENRIRGERRRHQFTMKRIDRHVINCSQ